MSLWNQGIPAGVTTSAHASNDDRGCDESHTSSDGCTSQRKDS
jgi:hypothetical protein